MPRAPVIMYVYYVYPAMSGVSDWLLQRQVNNFGTKLYLLIKMMIPV
jgi:hypothetical protein